MGERHMVSVEAVRRWLTFANVSEYQRAALRSLCDAAAERDRLQRENAALREALQAISDEFGVIHKGTFMDPDAEVYMPIAVGIRSETIVRARAVLAAVPADARGEDAPLAAQKGGE